MSAAEPQIGTPPEPQVPQAQPAAPAATGSETVSREEHQRELDRYRNQVGAEKKKAEEMAAELAALKDASKSEAEKIAQKAQEFDALMPRVKRLEKALKAQVEAMKAQLSEPLQALIPEAEPEVQFEHAQKLLAAQAQILPQQPRETLPTVGGRNPAPGGPGVDDKRAFEEAQELFPTLKGMVPARRGP